MGERRKLRPPYGAIEQQELAALPATVGTAAIAMIVALRVRSNGDGWTRDRVASLARWGHLSEGNARRALDELVALGVAEERRERAKGEGRGHAWSWRRRVLPLEAWPEELRTVRPSSPDVVRVVRGSAPEAVLTDGGLFARKSRSNSGEEVLKTRGRGAQTTRHNPTSYPASLPDDVGVEVDLALDELASVAGYTRDRDAYLAVVDAFSRRRPTVALVREVERWAERARDGEVRDGPKALAAWLEVAKDAPTSQVDPECVVEGCRGRGRGASRRCVKHLELGVLS